MQIILVQAEIDAAIRSHLSSRFNIDIATPMAIELAATRGTDGFRATIDIAHEALFPNNRLQACVPVAVPAPPAVEIPAPVAAAPEPTPAPQTPAEPETPTPTTAKSPAAVAAPARTPKIFARPQLVTPPAPVAAAEPAGDPPFETEHAATTEAGGVEVPAETPAAETGAAPPAPQDERRSLFKGLKRPQS